MKVGVYGFGLNEEHNIASWLHSARNADHITFVDTGSTDSTLVIADSVAIIGHKRVGVHRAAIRPFRFDTAHNLALALMPADIDVAVCLHLDERLSDFWLDDIIEHWTPEATQGWYDYEFAPGLTFRTHRIHARHGFVWRYPAHEGLYWIGDRPELGVDFPRLKITQTQDRSIDRMSRDIWLLELGLKENPSSARMHFYLGRQYMYAGRYADAVPLLRKYLHMEDRWAGEAAQAADALAICYRNGVK